MTLLDRAIASLQSAARNYEKDLAAMTDEQLMQSAGGAARKPVDFTFETALINRRIAARIRGEEPEPEPEGEWWEAPEELRNRAAITEYMRASCQAILDAASGLSEEEAEKPIGESGSERPPISFIHFAALHTMYHCAQLNFIQTLSGDLSMHWG